MPKKKPKAQHPQAAASPPPQQQQQQPLPRPQSPVPAKKSYRAKLFGSTSPQNQFSKFLAEQSDDYGYEEQSSQPPSQDRQSPAKPTSPKVSEVNARRLQWEQAEADGSAGDDNYSEFHGTSPMGHRRSIDDEYLDEAEFDPNMARAHTVVKHRCEDAFRRLLYLKVVAMPFHSQR